MTNPQTKTLLVDKNGRVVPQYFDAVEGKFKPLSQEDVSHVNVRNTQILRAGNGEIPYQYLKPDGQWESFNVALGGDGPGPDPTVNFVRSVNMLLPNLQGNVDIPLEYKIVDLFDADTLPFEFDVGTSVLSFYFDPAANADWADLFAGRVPAGDIIIKTMYYPDAGLTIQEIDPKRDGIYFAALSRSNNGNSWGPLVENYFVQTVNGVAPDEDGNIEVPRTVVVDNLTSTDVDKALSAKQGKTLKDEADTHNAKVASSQELGHVKIDDYTIKLNNDEQLYATNATSTSKGIVQLASSAESTQNAYVPNVEILNAAIAAHASLRASDTTFGHVKIKDSTIAHNDGEISVNIDGTSIVINESGKLSAVSTETTQYVHLDDTLIPDSPLENINQGVTISKYFSANASNPRDTWLALVNNVYGWQCTREHIGMEVETVRSGNDIQQTVNIYMVNPLYNQGDRVAQMFRIYQNASWQGWHRNAVIRTGNVSPKPPTGPSTIYGMVGNMYMWLPTGKMFIINTAATRTPNYMTWVDYHVNAVASDFVPENGDMNSVFSAEATLELISEHALKKASETELGHVKVDGASIVIDENGVISTESASIVIYDDDVIPTTDIDSFDDCLTITTMHTNGFGTSWINFIDHELGLMLTQHCYAEIRTLKDIERISQVIDVYVDYNNEGDKGKLLFSASRMAVMNDESATPTWSTLQSSHPVMQGIIDPQDTKWGIMGSIYINNMNGKIYKNRGATLNKNQWEDLIKPATADDYGLVKADGLSLTMSEDGIISVVPSLGGPGAEPPMKEITFEEMVGDEFWDTGVFVLRASEDNAFNFPDAGLNSVGFDQDWIVDLTYDQFYDETLDALIKIKHIEVSPVEGQLSYYFRATLKHTEFYNSEASPTTVLSEFYPAVAPMNSNTFFTDQGIYDINVAHLVESSSLFVKQQNGKLDVHTGSSSVKGVTYLSGNPLHTGTDSAPTSLLFKGVYEDVEELKDHVDVIAPTYDDEDDTQIPGHVIVDGETITIDENGVISAVGGGGGGGGGEVSEKFWYSARKAELTSPVSQAYITFDNFDTGGENSGTVDGTSFTLEAGKKYRITYAGGAMFSDQSTGYIQVGLYDTVTNTLLHAQTAMRYAKENMFYGLSGSMEFIYEAEETVQGAFRLRSVNNVNRLLEIHVTVEEIGSVVGGGGGSDIEVINTLTSNSTANALSAAQGKALKTLIDNHKDEFAPVDDGEGNDGVLPGHVIVDGETITIDANGVISSTPAIPETNAEEPAYSFGYSSYLASNKVVQEPLEVPYVYSSGFVINSINTVTLQEGRKYRIQFSFHSHPQQPTNSNMSIELYDVVRGNKIKDAHASSEQGYEGTCMLIMEPDRQTEIGLRMASSNFSNEIFNLRFLVEEIKPTIHIGDLIDDTIPVIDNLTTEIEEYALSAKQGSILNDMHGLLRENFDLHTLYLAPEYDEEALDPQVAGHVIVDGETIVIDEDGVISAVGGGTLPTASETVLGGVKIDGETITIDEDGVISASADFEVINSLSSTSVDDALSAAKGKELKEFSDYLEETMVEHIPLFAPTDDGDGNVDILPGHVYVDGDTITIDANGVISVANVPPSSYSIKNVYFGGDIDESDSEISIMLPDSYKAEGYTWEVYEDGLLIPSNLYILDGEEEDQMIITFASTFNYSSRITLRGQKVEVV